MAATNYNELSHSTTTSTDCDTLDPLYKYDTHFPERLSRLHLGGEDLNTTNSTGARRRRQRARNSARFKTQPITFDEIKEVDEEPLSPEVGDLKSQFSAFSKSMDGLLPSLQQAAAASKHLSKSPSPADAGPASGSAEFFMDTSSPSGLPDSVQNNSMGAADASVVDMSEDIPGLTQLPKLSRTRRSRRRSRKGIEEEPEREAAASQNAG